jgi:hypothetical protein
MEDAKNLALPYIEAIVLYGATAPMRGVLLDIMCAQVCTHAQSGVGWQRDIFISKAF